VYRFLLKPVSPGRARLAIEASVKHHLEAPDKAFKPKPGTSTVAAPAPAKADAPAKPEPRREPAVKPNTANKPTAGRIEPTIGKSDAAQSSTKKLPRTETSAAPRADRDQSPLGNLGDKALSLGNTALSLVSEFISRLPQSRKLQAIAGGTLIAVVAVAWIALTGDADEAGRTAEAVTTQAEQPAPAEPPSAGETQLSPITETAALVDEASEPLPRPVVSPAPNPWAGELELARAARDSGNLINRRTVPADTAAF
jgi:hypothetical protein